MGYASLLQALELPINQQRLSTLTPKDNELYQLLSAVDSHSAFKSISTGTQAKGESVIYYVTGTEAPSGVVCLVRDNPHFPKHVFNRLVSKKTPNQCMSCAWSHDTKSRDCDLAERASVMRRLAKEEEDVEDDVQMKEEEDVEDDVQMKEEEDVKMKEEEDSKVKEEEGVGVANHVDIPTKEAHLRDILNLFNDMVNDEYGSWEKLSEEERESFSGEFRRNEACEDMRTLRAFEELADRYFTNYPATQYEEY